VPISYQWKKNLAPISNATNSSLTLANLQVSDSATYQCTVSNPSGLTATSLNTQGIVYVTNTPVRIVLQPANQTKIAGNDITMKTKILTTATGPITYQWAQFTSLTTSNVLADDPGNPSGQRFWGATTANLTVRNVQSGDAGTYICTIVNPAGITNTLDTQGILTITPDSVKPVAVILTPRSNSRMTNLVTTTTNELGATVTAPQVVLKGVATDKGLITNVSITQKYYNTNGTLVAMAPVNVGLYTLTSPLTGLPLPGLKRFTNTFTLQDGTNEFYTVATDSAGLTNTPIVNKLFLVRTATLVVNNVPIGNASGQHTNGLIPAAILGFGVASNGNSLEIGRNYTLKALPDLNCTCTNITDGVGTVISNNTAFGGLTARFRMCEGLVLNVNFITNPIIAAGVNGTYNGLFYEDAGVTEQTAGSIENLIVGTNLSYAGLVITYGKPHVIAGKFDVNGDMTKTVSRAIYGRSNLVVSLHLDWETNGTRQITGTISSTNSAAVAWSAKATNDQAGQYSTGARYTMALPQGVGAPTTSPGGYGYGTITNFGVGSPLAGKMQLIGATADGAAIVKLMAVSKDANVPVNIPMYTNSGILFGWLNFTSGKPTGNLNWIKTSPSLFPTNYQAGFTNLNIIVEGSPYTPPAIGVRALEMTGGSVTVIDLNEGPDATLTWDVLLSTANKITKQSTLGYATNLLSGTVVGATGSMSMAFRPTGSGAILKIGAGVVMQNATNGVGRFTGTNGYTGSLFLDHP
jgi:hypothetical protein